MIMTSDKFFSYGWMVSPKISINNKLPCFYNLVPGSR